MISPDKNYKIDSDLENTLSEEDFKILEKKNEISKLENKLRFNDKKEELYTLDEIDRRIQKSIKNDKNFIKLLEYFGYKDLTNNIEKINEKVFRVPIEDLGSVNIKLRETGMEKIPYGYGFKGGTARYIMLLMLGLVKEEDSPRDFDLISFNNDNSSDLEMAEIFCPEDLVNGDKYGVEKLKKNYFKSRDFVFNEIYTDDSFVYFSKQCILDLIRRVIRFSEFEKNENFYSYEKVFIKSKLVTKACRMLAINKVSFDINSRIANSEIIDTNINNFDISLHLDRSFKSGIKVAIQYIKELNNLNLISLTDEELKNPILFIKKFIDNKGRFNYENIPKELLEESNNNNSNLNSFNISNELEDTIDNANSYFDSPKKYSSKKYK